MGDTIVIETPVATVLEVTGLQGPQGPTGPQGPSGEASGSIAWSNVTGKPSTFTPSAHTHTSADVTDFASAVVAAAPPTTNASLLTSGTLADARLSAAVTTSLGKADTASQPGHTHAVSDVTGLQTALDGKQASGSYAAASHTHTPSEVGLGNVSNTAQVTSVTGTAPIVSSGGTTPAISIQNSPTFTGDVVVNGASAGATGTLKVGNTTGSFNRVLELGDNGIVLRNVGSSGTTTIALGQGGTNNYTLTPPAASGTIALTSNTVSSVSSSASDVLGVSGANITGVDANADRIVFWDDSASALKYLEAGSGLSISGTTLTATATGTIGGSTSTDNAIVRADSTSNTVQDSAFIIADNATSSPNNTVNHASIQATGGTTNVSVSIVPKGSGSFSLHVPDAVTAGGNARGANAVDFQTSRSAAAQVASGANAVLAGGTGNTASGTQAVVCGGSGNAASGFQSAVLGGRSNTANNDRCFAFGDGNTASSTNAVAFGAGNTASSAQTLAIGSNSRADRQSLLAHAAGAFASAGDAQRIRAVLRCKTTTNAAVEMALDGSTTYLTIPSGKVIFCNIKVVGVKSDGSVVATYERQYAAKNVAGTSSEVYAAVTIGTDNAASTSLEIATVDAGDYIRIRPTGILSEVWRWVASVDAVECAYGS